MAEIERTEQSQGEPGDSASVLVSAWDDTRTRPVSEAFSIEVAGHESWTPTWNSWEVRHTFEGLTPGGAYVLCIRTGVPGADPIELRFWLNPPTSRDRENQIPDYLIQVADDQISVLYPGIRTSEQTFARHRPPTVAGRAHRLWTRWGAAIVFGVIFVALFLTIFMSDDDTARTRTAAGSPPATVDVTLRATRLDGSQEMVISFENGSGGTEEHVISDEVWERAVTRSSIESVWLEVTNRSPTGAVRCEILRNGEPWISATSSGARVTAHCYGYANVALE